MTARRGNHDWYSDEEDAAIIAQWPDGPLAALAGQLDRSYDSIKNRAQALARAGRLDPAKRFYLRPWTDEEDDVLREHWGTVSDRVLGKRLGRSAEAVRVRGYVLGLAKRENRLTAAAVARLLGIDQHRVSRLLADGLLRGRRVRFTCGPGYEWDIPVGALERFLTKYPEHYDPRRIEEEPWKRLAREAQTRDPLLSGEEAAVLLGCCTETVVRHCRAGTLPAVRVAGRGSRSAWLIRRSELDTFRFRKRRLPPPPPAPRAAARVDRRPRLGPDPDVRSPRPRPVDWRSA